jgi:(2R)-3-sulfolactate dehydrogenase (NADP+)
VLSSEASPFSGTAGGPPRTGHFFIAIDAMTSSGGRFADTITRLVATIDDQPKGRRPGAKRAAARAGGRAWGADPL